MTFHRLVPQASIHFCTIAKSNLQLAKPKTKSSQVTASDHHLLVLPGLGGGGGPGAGVGAAGAGGAGAFEGVPIFLVPSGTSPAMALPMLQKAQVKPRMTSVILKAQAELVLTLNGHQVMTMNRLKEQEGMYMKGRERKCSAFLSE